MVDAVVDRHAHRKCNALLQVLVFLVYLATESNAISQVRQHQLMVRMDSNGITARQLR